MPDQSGSVTAKGYESASRVSHFVYDSEIKVIQGVGGLFDRSTGPHHFEPLQISKPLDKATKTLLNYYHQSKVIPKLEIHECATVNKKLQWVTKHTFFNVLLSAVSRQAGGHGHSEVWAMHYSRYEFGYQPLGADHKPESPSYVGYDLEKGEPL